MGTDERGAGGMSDCDRLVAMFSASGERGVFSGDIRREGISGNPSQRIADLERRGFTFRQEREAYPSGKRRMGVRWWIVTRPAEVVLPALGPEAVPALDAARERLQRYDGHLFDPDQLREAA
jgi:hypothetical protein